MLCLFTFTSLLKSKQHTINIKDRFLSLDIMFIWQKKDIPVPFLPIDYPEFVKNSDSPPHVFSQPLSHPHLLATIDQFSDPVVWSLQECRANGVLQQEFFCNWLLSRSIVCPRFCVIHQLVVCYLSFLTSIPLYPVCLSTFQLRSIWDVSSFWQFQM